MKSMTNQTNSSELYIINQYYAPFFAATGQLLQDLAEHFAAKGINVTVITGRNGNKHLPKQEVLNGVTVRRLSNSCDGNSIGRKFLSYLTYFLALFFELIFHVNKDSRILVLSTPPLVSLAPAFLKGWKGFRIVHNIQDIYPDVLGLYKKRTIQSFLFPILRAANKYIFKKSDRIVVIGSSLKQQIESRYELDKSQIYVIENWGLRDIEESLKRTARSESDDFLLVIYTGNLGRAHEYETLLGAVKALDHNDRIQFKISGGGFHFSKMKKQCEALGLKNIKFQSYVPKEELAGLIYEADVCLLIGSKQLSGLILPSKFYGYLACGKPVIYITSGNDDLTYHIKKGGFGYVVSNGDSSSLAEILDKLSKNVDEVSKLTGNACAYQERELARDRRLDSYYRIIKGLESA